MTKEIDKGVIGDVGKCRFGCRNIEDAYHISVHCDRFEKWRNEAREGILCAMREIIDRTGVEEAHMASFLIKAKSFFTDSPVLGLPTELHFTWGMFLTIIWHTAGIRLASRIWDEVQREIARRKDIIEGRRRGNGWN